MKLKNWLKIFLILLIFIVIGLFAYDVHQYLFIIFIIKEFQPLTSLDLLSKVKIETVIRLGKWDNESLNSLLEESKKYKNTNDRIDYISQRFLGTPYKAQTLIGDKDSPEKFVVNLEGVDCFTFLDYVLSLVIADDANDFYKKLKFIRYRVGQVDFQTRNHFFSQWIDNNDDYLFNASNTFKNSVCLIKELNKKEDGGYWVEGIFPFKKRVCYIAKEIVLNKSFNSNFEKGDIIGLYTNLKGLDVRHLGIISIRDAGIYFRHASLRHKEVVDEKLERYLNENKIWDGLIIVRTLDNKK